MGGWRGLAVFWIVVLAALGGGAAWLQSLPPLPAQVAAGKVGAAHKPAIQPAAAPAPAPTTPPAAPAPSNPATAATTAASTAMAAAHPGRLASPGTAPAIAAPDPAISEPADPATPAPLPRIGPDGQMAMTVYAAPFAAPPQTPRVALILGGIGLNTADSQAAITGLPGPVSLSVSPYAPDPSALLAQARAQGHEYLVELPLEPARYPLEDPGQETLLTGAPEGVNKERLDWALTRFAGYVGAIGALGGMRGERFAQDTVAMHRLLRRLAGRGLLYVDPRPGAAALPEIWQRRVDVVIDSPADSTAIDAALNRLDEIARAQGAALGYAASPAPVTRARIAVWAASLAAQGLVLAPASAIMRAPPAGQAKP